MPDVQFQKLLRMIEQLGLEHREFAASIEEKFNIISTSLKSCQSHCHVANPPNMESA
jgi:hypothetical protein